MAEDSDTGSMLQAVAKGLDDVFNGSAPKTTGFALFVFESGKTAGGMVNYVSNAERDDMITAVREWLARHDGRYVETGGRA